MKEVFRTEVENLLLEEMVEEDAKFLLLGDDEEDVDSTIFNTSDSLFGDDVVSLDIDDDDVYNEEDDIDEEDEEYDVY